MTTRARKREAPRQSLRQVIDETLGGYADRGVFRGFSATDERGGVRQYRFLWLTRRPTVLRLSRDGRALTFDALFPDVLAIPRLRQALQARVRSQTDPGRPAHRRLDARRATISTRLEKGHLALRLSIKVHQGRGGEYAVRAALGVVNELFLFLHEVYPDYLAAQFGVSQE